MQQPLLSVIIPAHNVAPYLQRCVDSILTQPGPAREVIVVDDASSDGTAALCDQFARQDVRVKVLHGSFRDVSLARNAGLAIASGDYIGFADGDDTVAPTLMQALSDVLRRSRPDVIRFGYEALYPDGRRETHLLPDPPGLCPDLRQQRLDAISPANVLDFQQILSVWAHFFRRSFLMEENLQFVSQREILSEDYLFVLHALCRADTVWHLKQPLYCYITRPGSLSRAPKPRMMERKQALIRCYLRFLPPEDPEVKRRLRNFYIASVYDCFVNAALQSARAGEALKQIRVLLRDEHLCACIRENRDRIVTRKARCICFLMAHRLGTVMYLLYRLLIGRKAR